MKDNKMNRLLKLSLTLPALLIIAGCARHDDQSLPVPKQQAPEQSVGIDNFSFTPAELVVAPGTKVTWTNHDDVPHTVTATDKSFSSSALDTGDRFSRTFTNNGSYSYYCAVHPHMTARIIVK
jgi:plastocyanin